MRWAREHGCPWNETTCQAAAMGGHLEVLRWLREHDCPWDSRTCAVAALGGHLEVLRWAREHGCPWNSSTCIHAAMNGELEVLQVVQENDATGEAWDENRVRTWAYGPRKQKVLTWLDQVGAP